MGAPVGPKGQDRYCLGEQATPTERTEKTFMCVSKQA